MSCSSSSISVETDCFEDIFLNSNSSPPISSTTNFFNKIDHSQLQHHQHDFYSYTDTDSTSPRSWCSSPPPPPQHVGPPPPIHPTTNNSLKLTTSDSDDEIMLQSQDNFLESIRYGSADMNKQQQLQMMIIEQEDDKLFGESDDQDVNIIDDNNFDILLHHNNHQQIQQQQHHQEVKVVQLFQLGFNSINGKTIQIVEQQEARLVDNEESEEDDSDSNSNGSDSASPINNPNNSNAYQELKLSDEEKRLLSKEGIALPSHYPLTKFEERELKRIRRKIRNKISAQDSRKRKKEYLDKLQQRVVEIEEEKTLLSKKVRTLESANAKLATQVKRLMMQQQQQQQNKNNNVPAATTLLVLILSLALVVLPTNSGGGTAPSSIREAGAAAMATNNSIQQQPHNNNNNNSINNNINKRQHQESPGMRSRTMISEVDEKLLFDGFSSVDDDIPPMLKMARFSFQHHDDQEENNIKTFHTITPNNNEKSVTQQSY